jgi:nicotinic acid phosphoribosyltransferase
VTSDITATAVSSTGLLTDHYELTMIRAALEGGTASRRTVFEMFARSCRRGGDTASWPEPGGFLTLWPSSGSGRPS